MSPGFYPEWKTIQGSPSATDGAMVLPSDGNRHIADAAVRQGDGTLQGYRFSQMMTGTWSWEYQWQSTPSSGSVDLYPIRESGGDYWTVFVNSNGTINLNKGQDGSFNGGLLSGSYTVDTNIHTVSATRSADIDGNGNTGWELFIDGVSQGTTTDSFAPEPNNRRIDYDSSTDADLHIRDYKEERETGEYR